MGVAEVRALAQYIVPSARRYGILPSLFAGLVHLESGGDNSPRPWGTGPYRDICATSTAGAIGVAQVMPFHFVPGQNPCDPATNIDVGCRVLRGAYDRCGDWDKALAGYFGALDGQCNVTDWSDGSGATGWDYIRIARGYQQSYLDLDKVVGEVCPPGYRWNGAECVPTVHPPGPASAAALLLGAVLLLAAAAVYYQARGG